MEDHTDDHNSLATPPGPSSAGDVIHLDDHRKLMASYHQADLPDTVTGHLIDLDDTRLVFVGASPDHPGVFFVGFRNSQGEDTKLKLSQEAVKALVKLVIKPPRGKKVHFPQTLNKTWRVVSKEEKPDYSS